MNSGTSSRPAIWLRTIAILAAAAILLTAPIAHGLTPQERRNYTYQGITFIDEPCTIGSTVGSGLVTGEAEKANAKIVIGIAKTMNIGPEGARVGLITGLQESGLRNYANDGSAPLTPEQYYENRHQAPTFPYRNTRLAEISQSLPHDDVGNNYDSVGIMQQRVTGGWAKLGSSLDNLNNPDVIGRLMNPAFAVQAFYERMIAVPDWQNEEPGSVAQAVQVSEFPDAYSKWVPDANALIQQLWGSSPAIPLVVPSDVAVTPSLSCYSSGKDAVYQKIMEYAWPRFNDSRSEGSEDIGGCSGNCKRKGKYREAVERASYVGGCQGVDCGAFVTIVMRESGADPEYNTGPGPFPNVECNTKCQLAYLRRSSGPGGKYTRVMDKSELLPVDVVIAIRDDGMFGGRIGHTFIYIGDALNGQKDDAEIEWSGVTASASHCGRAPMASGMDNFNEYEWYRLN